jgi:hypothetical protein
VPEQVDPLSIFHKKPVAHVSDTLPICRPRGGRFGFRSERAASDATLFSAINASSPNASMPARRAQRTERRVIRFQTQRPRITAEETPYQGLATRSQVGDLACDPDERTLQGCKEEVNMFGLANERRAHFK